MHKLAEHCDIVVENYMVGQLAKYRLDYASLAKINPRLIYCSITGFGQTGPHRTRAGYDFIMQGIGGFMSITGERDDRPGGGPQKAGVAVSDLMTGMYSAVAILAAVTHRERTGQGQYIDMALYDVMVAMLANMNMNYLTSGKAPSRSGNAHPNIVPYQVFAAADGHVVVAVGNDSQFVKFCAVAGAPHLAADARYRRNADRVRNREVLIASSKPFCAQSLWPSGSKVSTRPASRAGRSTTSRTPLPIRKSTLAAYGSTLPTRSRVMCRWLQIRSNYRPRHRVTSYHHPYSANTLPACCATMPTSMRNN